MGPLWRVSPGWGGALRRAQGERGRAGAPTRDAPTVRRRTGLPRTPLAQRGGRPSTGSGRTGVGSGPSTGSGRTEAGAPTRDAPTVRRRTGLPRTPLAQRGGARTGSGRTGGEGGRPFDGLRVNGGGRGRPRGTPLPFAAEQGFHVLLWRKGGGALRQAQGERGWGAALRQAQGERRRGRPRGTPLPFAAEQGFHVLLWRKGGRPSTGSGRTEAGAPTRDAPTVRRRTGLPRTPLAQRGGALRQAQGERGWGAALRQAQGERGWGADRLRANGGGERPFDRLRANGGGGAHEGRPYRSPPNRASTYSSGAKGGALRQAQGERRRGRPRGTPLPFAAE